MPALSAELLAATAAPPPITHAGDARLAIAALAGIAVIVALITRWKVHAFLALTIGSGVLGLVAGAPLAATVTSYSTGLGATVASVGTLVALGAILGKLLADSGGADVIVDTILERTGERRLPWAMTLIAALVGLPLFFEIGIVLLVPVVLLVARRGNQSLMRVGMPALAGLSVMHGLVPPHPGPLAAVSAIHADLGTTLAFGVLVAIPSVIVAGPLFGRVADHWVKAEPPERMTPARASEGLERRPGFVPTVCTMLLPVVLMLAKALVDVLVKDQASVLYRVFDVLGTPLVALLIAVFVAMFTLGRAAGFGKERVSGIVDASLGPIAGIVLIVGAGGGFKQVLVDAGVGQMILDTSRHWHIPALLLAWLIAVLIRVATGSATVATISAAGLVAPLAAHMSSTHTALLVLAVGAGSLFFSHVNDAGFWLVKEYFGMDVPQTLKSWSVMESLVSVVALALVLALSLVV
ncbi:GntP family permease [Streptomyces sp. PTM05]|uniref:GntP family permease n=1 Tax=Streptantibioticus parmotrematis TaxID=2873249 RepID=A0ABS7QP75_9ACTN|nr:gluconate:H+ symporter [Streptantibioticus parmotrematis]MBY8884566.1 GntP family permease [Streptantibioticus parmotrematis]